MAFYRAPQRDSRFLLNDVLNIDSWSHLKGYGEMSSDLVDSIIDQAALFAERVIAPLNAPGDAEGSKWHPDGSVTLPQGFPEARRQLHEAGWGSMSLPAEIGGQGLPDLLRLVVTEYFCTASQSFSMHSGMNNGSINVLMSQGSHELQRIYVARLASGEWASTMNLTEPQCGSDLSLLRTKAVPQADGTYKISGTKIFISGGEQNLTENIVHLVLARTPDAPEGTRGISLFVVPKFFVENDGTLGARNAVSCSGIEHKMGLKATATCTMNYEEATGWLVGEENKGLAGMFILMNSARLNVGIQGLATAEISYQNAAQYAQERRQGRAPGGARDPKESADPLFVHPDVRRMLMDAKAATEALRCLGLWCGLLNDINSGSSDPAKRQDADDLLGLLTPIIKGYGTEIGFKTAVNMQQIWGGHGYIVENGMEQFVRDGRIAMIYEGANGIQANDLVGRKIGANGGRALKRFFAEIEAECDATRSKPELAAIVAGVEAGLADLKATTEWLLVRNGEHPAASGAVAFHYLMMAGIMTLALMWLRMARAALAKLEAGATDRSYLKAKIITAQHFMNSFVPETISLRRKVEAGFEQLMALAADQFIAA